MAFHCRSQSQTRSSSSPPRGVEIGGGNGNKYQQFEDTVPLDDTMVLDSPLAETQLEKLDFETQVVDDFYRHEEVVLDSEDEGICKNEREKVANDHLSDHNALNLQKRASAYVDEQSNVVEGNKGCEVNVKRSDEQKDLPQLFTCNSGSSEPGEESQANALEFVDQFLSFNKVDLSSGLDIKKSVGEKSPPVPRTKGPHVLAKRMNFRVTSLANPGNFEWADSDQHRKDDVFSKRIGAPSAFGGFGQRYVRRDQKARHLNSKGCSISGNGHEEKKKLVNMQKEMMDSKHSDSRFENHSAKETSRIEQESKRNLENNTVEEFIEDLHAESPEQQLDAPEMFDVGFNTQIAAEAMEALSYGPRAGCITFDAYQGPLNSIEDSLRATTIREDHLEHSSRSKSDFSDVEGIARKSKRRKRSAGKSGKKPNNWGLHPELLIMKKVKRDEEQFNCKNFANSIKNSSRISPKLIFQRQLDGTVGSNNEKCENNLSSPLSVEHIFLRTEQAEGKPKSSSTLADEPRQSLAGDTFKRTNDQSDNPGESKEDCILKYRRKRSRSVVNPTKVASTIGGCSELFSDSSSEARNSKLKQEELNCKGVKAITSCLKLDIWSHPKGKRALRKVQSRLKSNTSYAPLATINENVGKSYYIRSQRRTEHKDKTSCDNIDTKGNIRSELHSSSRNSSEDLRKNLEPGPAVVISNTEPGSRCKEIFPTEPEKQLPFKQSSKVKDMHCLLFSNGAEKKHKFGVSSKRNLEPLGPGYYKRPFKKNLPKSSLLKELIKLGVPESKPDFTLKDLRRRRDIAYVRVLFSQHLDDNIIKQQKKISARLGISIATCPMDATHFIADRFVRTRNMLEAIALGKPVVTHLWLESCGQASCLIDEKNYILRDAKKEKKIGYSMPVSFARAIQHPLLKGLRVFITPNIKPPKEMINGLVKAVQGQVVERSQISVPKDRKIQDDLLILSCEEDHALCAPFLDKGVAVYSSELLLNGIVIQKLEFERHRLFKNHGKRN